MANNRTRIAGKRLMLTVTDGGVLSGDPCLVGLMGGVVETPKDANNRAVVSREGVYSLSVKGVTTAGAGSAVNRGDKIYYVPGNTPKLSKAVGDAGAVFFGWAGDNNAKADPQVASAATTTVEVILAGGSYS